MLDLILIANGRCGSTALYNALKSTDLFSEGNVSLSASKSEDYFLREMILEGYHGKEFISRLVDESDKPVLLKLPEFAFHSHWLHNELSKKYTVLTFSITREIKAQIASLMDRINIRFWKSLRERTNTDTNIIKNTLMDGSESDIEFIYKILKYWNLQITKNEPSEHHHIIDITEFRTKLDNILQNYLDTDHIETVMKTIKKPHGFTERSKERMRKGDFSAFSLSSEALDIINRLDPILEEEWRELPPMPFKDEGLDLIYSEPMNRFVNGRTYDTCQGTSDILCVLIVNNNKELSHLDETLMYLNKQVLKPYVMIIDFTGKSNTDYVTIKPKTNEQIVESVKYCIARAREHQDINHICFYHSFYEFHKDAFWAISEALKWDKFKGGLLLRLPLLDENKIRSYNPNIGSDPIIPLERIKDEFIPDKYDSQMLNRIYLRCNSHDIKFYRINLSVVGANAHATDEDKLKFKSYFQRDTLIPNDLKYLPIVRMAKNKHIVGVGRWDKNGNGARLAEAVNRHTDYHMEVITRKKPRYQEPPNTIYENEKNKGRIHHLLQTAGYILFLGSDIQYRPYNIELNDNIPRGVYHVGEGVAGNDEFNEVHMHLDHAFVYDRTLKSLKRTNLIYRPINVDKFEFVERDFNKDKLRIGHSPSVQTEWYKGTDKFREALKKFDPNGKYFDVDIITGVPLEECLERKKKCDVFFDQITAHVTEDMVKNGWFPGPAVSSQEAMLFGCYSFTMNTSDYPMHNVYDVSTIIKELAFVVNNRDKLPALCRKQRKYVADRHNYRHVANMFINTIGGKYQRLSKRRL